MKTSIPALITIVTLVPLLGCVSVQREAPPETVTTTTTSRHVTANPTVPVTTTVERTTTY